MAMGIPELTRAYAALTPKDQAVFAAIVRAHQTFNNPHWKQELADRHARIEGGAGARVSNVETLLNSNSGRR